MKNYFHSPLSNCEAFNGREPHFTQSESLRITISPLQIESKLTLKGFLETKLKFTPLIFSGQAILIQFSECLINF